MGQGHALDCAAGLREACDRVVDATYDLIVLEPAVDGSFERGLCWIEELRSSGVSSPLLVLSSAAGVGERVAALDRGADDVVAKPFAVAEVAARARSLLRRAVLPVRDVVEVGPLRLDRTQREASGTDGPLPLTPRELSLLEYLMLNAGRALSRGSIAEHVWDASYSAASNVIDVIVARLRRKLRQAGCGGLLATVHGLGYVLREGTGTDC